MPDHVTADSRGGHGPSRANPPQIMADLPSSRHCRRRQRSRARDHRASASRPSLRAAPTGRKIARLQKINQEVTPCRAKLRSIRCCVRKRSQGNSRRGRDGRDGQGGGLSGRVRQTRPVQGRRHDGRQRVLDRLDDEGDHRLPPACNWSSRASSRSTSRSARCCRISPHPRCSKASTPTASQNFGLRRSRSRCAIS